MLVHVKEDVERFVTIVTRLHLSQDHVSEGSHELSAEAATLFELIVSSSPAASRIVRIQEPAFELFETLRAVSSSSKVPLHVDTPGESARVDDVPVLLRGVEVNDGHVVLVHIIIVQEEVTGMSVAVDSAVTLSSLGDGWRVQDSILPAAVNMSPAGDRLVSGRVSSLVSN